MAPMTIIESFVVSIIRIIQLTFDPKRIFEAYSDQDPMPNQDPYEPKMQRQ